MSTTNGNRFRFFGGILTSSSFRIEQFLNSKNNLTTLRMESTDDLEKNDFPSFLKVKEDITENEHYFTYYISLHSETELN